MHAAGMGAFLLMDRENDFTSDNTRSNGPGLVT